MRTAVNAVKVLTKLEAFVNRVLGPRLAALAKATLLGEIKRATARGAAAFTRMVFNRINTPLQRGLPIALATTISAIAFATTLAKLFSESEDSVRS